MSVAQQGQVTRVSDWCVLEAGEFVQAPLSFHLDSLRWKRTGPHDPDDHQNLTVILDGLRMVAVSGSPWVDYMMLQQSLHNVATGEAAIVQTGDGTGLSVRLGVENGFNFSIVFDGTDPDGAIWNWEFPESGSIRYASIQVENQGSFDSTVFSILSGLLRHDEASPPVAIDAWKKRTRAQIDDLPQSLIGHQGRFALGVLLDAMPMPHGTATLTFAPKKQVPLAGIGAQIRQLNLLALEELPGLLGGNPVEFWYENSGAGR